MIKRWKQRKRLWLATKLLQMKPLQQLKQSGDGIIVAVVIVFRISIAAVVVIILLIMINAIMPGMIARTTSQRRSRPSSPLSTASTPSSPATSLWSKPSSKDSYHCDDWHQSFIILLNILRNNTTAPQVKSMKNPAPIVKFVIESVCVMKGILPKRCQHQRDPI